MRRFWTNQQHNLIFMLAQAGLNDDAIRQALETDPILLEATDIDVTEYDGIAMVHFCRSRWEASGFESQPNVVMDNRLSYHPLVRLACEPPAVDRRYSCIAELTFNAGTQTATLTMLHFDEMGPIPQGTNISLEKQKFVEHPLLADFVNETRPQPQEVVCSP